MNAEFHFSIDDFVDELDREPELAFKAKSREDWILWRSRLRAKLFELMEPMPQGMPLRPKVIETAEGDGFLRHKVVYTTEAKVDVPAYLFIPRGATKRKPVAGIVALHGHGVGKGSVSGFAAGDDPHHDYAAQFAKRGFAVIAPDARGFGERSEGFGRPKPGETAGRYGTRDPCNVSLLRTLLFGINLMARNIWDDLKAVDVLAARPEVDADRLGCVGLSFGGTRTMYLTAVDPRIKAAIISGYLTTFSEYALRMGNFCGSQFLPGIYRYADVPDVTATIAPRPLLIEAGVKDPGFPIAASRKAHAVLERAYAVAGASDRLERDEFDGGHQFSGRRAFDFMGKWLSAAN